MPNIANLAQVAGVRFDGSTLLEPFAVLWTRHHGAGLKEVSALSSDGSIVKVANATIYPRHLSAGWSFGGGESDPVGPQRWPLKL